MHESANKHNPNMEQFEQIVRDCLSPDNAKRRNGEAQLQEFKFREGDHFFLFLTSLLTKSSFADVCVRALMLIDIRICLGPSILCRYFAAGTSRGLMLAHHVLVESDAAFECKLSRAAERRLGYCFESFDQNRNQRDHYLSSKNRK